MSLISWILAIADQNVPKWSAALASGDNFQRAGFEALITCADPVALVQVLRYAGVTVITGRPQRVTRMSFCVLGSGSAGNCSALLLHHVRRAKPHVILIDLGLGIRETEKRLRAVDLALHMVDDIVITHFDSDHFRPVWINRLRKMRARVRFHMNHWPIANRMGALEFAHDAFDLECEITPGCVMHSVHLVHDREGTTGFLFECAAGRLGFATDLGHTPPPLFDLFQNLTLLAIESNYCPQLQEASNRPYFLKRRIMGGSGHLSNEESFDAVLRIAERSPDLRKVVLLHLSRECNSPGRILNIYAAHPTLSRKVVLTSQAHPINWINIDAPGSTGTPHVQHSLFPRARETAARSTDPVISRHG